MTSTLAEALEELQSGVGSVYNPRKLFSSLTKIWPQFGGGDQHDSHELLRHLLESVKYAQPKYYFFSPFFHCTIPFSVYIVHRNEDLKRYQKEILGFLNYYDDYKGKDLQCVPDDIKQKCKFYGQQASERILCPEKVFRGFLVSTLTCKDCLNTSSRHENFLDLSLPVCTEKPMPPIRRRSSPEELSPTKENLKPKYLRQQERRNNKKNNTSSQEESDADVEDNLSEDFNSKKSKTNVKKAIKSGMVDSNGNIESEKIDDDPENLNKDLNGWFF